MTKLTKTIIMTKILLTNDTFNFFNAVVKNLYLIVAAALLAWFYDFTSPKSLKL